MPKPAGLFGGQGSQYAGMGAKLLSGSARAREIHICAQDILGYDLKKICEDEVKLSRTLYAQPAIFALSVAVFETAKDTLGELPLYCVAGHSLGEYAALCAAGAFSVEDGFRIIKARAEAMDNAKTGGAMYAIMGMGTDDIARACEKADGYVIPANYNHPGQTVISGEEKAAAEAAATLSAAGATVVKLNVSGAFHTELMAEAAATFKAEIAGISFSPVTLSFYSNLTGGPLEISDYPVYFAKHMTSPVLFTKQIAAMTQSGVDTCVEFGAKKAAATLAKKNVKALNVLNVEDFDAINKLKEALSL